MWMSKLALSSPFFTPGQSGIDAKTVLSTIKPATTLQVPMGCMLFANPASIGAAHSFSGLPSCTDLVL